MIEADDDVPRLQRPHEDAADDVLRLYRGDGAGEDDDHGRVDPRPGDQLEPLLEGRNRNGRALGLQHLERVRIEGAREGHEAVPPRLSHGGPEDRTMAQMDAVERAERDGAAGGGRRDQSTAGSALTTSDQGIASAR